MASNKNAHHPDPAELRAANVKWAAAVKKADPDFFQRSKEGQYPRVSGTTVLSQSVILMYRRSCGSGVPIQEYPSPLSLPPDLETSSFTETSQSTFLLASHQIEFLMWNSQVHLTDDNLLSVLEYAVDHIEPVEHGDQTTLIQPWVLLMGFQLFLLGTQSAAGLRLV
jgi:hypothetical protein